MTRIERIFDCPMYSDCLAEKAKADAKIFTCADCKKDTTFIQEENMVSKVQSTPEIYARVQSRMLAMNLSVKRFAQLIGTSKSQIHKMRAGGEITLEYWDRVAKGLGVTTDWLLYGGKGLNEDKTVDSKQSTEDKNEAVGKQDETSPENEAPKPKRKNHPLCIAVGCDKIQAKGKYCYRHHRELMIDKASKPVEVEFTPVAEQPRVVKVLEIYEYAENGRKATIGIKDGKYSHVVLEGVKESHWTFDDIMFLGAMAREVEKLVKG